MTIFQNLPIYASDIAIAAIFALCATMFIRTMMNINILIRNLKNLMDSGIKPDDVIDKCYSVYPTESFDFHGQTFKRGMNIRLTTLQNKIYEGEIVGLNNQNMLCIITDELVIAQELNNVREITVLKNM